MGRGWKGRGDPLVLAERFGCGWILSGLEGARAWELGYGQNRLGNSPVPKAVWVAFFFFFFLPKDSWIQCFLWLKPQLDCLDPLPKTLLPPVAATGLSGYE